MVIEEKDFRLIPLRDGIKKFDLELLYTVNKGKENERQEFKNAAYGISLESALKCVADYRLCSMYADKTLDLRTYLKEYKGIIDEIKDLCKN
jgi:hypothetical protein